MTKSTGIKREIDKLGRIVLPIELRRTMELESGDAVEIYVEGSRVILEKYRPSCIFCGSSEEIVSYKDKNICSVCIAELKRAE
ncbi:MAG: AbrB/MazE/SpoVT family DNA-binding domain-containing protein [Clostridia bacterium]|nr:AbrB/MazE/SpoVT family DNA-binding domain-containing protein [Clostridia bacterium]